MRGVNVKSSTREHGDTEDDDPPPPSLRSSSHLSQGDKVDEDVDDDDDRLGFRVHLTRASATTLNKSAAPH